MWTLKRLGMMVLAGSLLSACTETNSDESLAPYRAQLVTNQGLNFQGLNFQGINFQGINFQGINFQGINFQGINFQGINFQGINFQGINFQGINFQGINFQGINFQGINFQGINFQGLTLNAIALDGSQLKGLLSNGRVVSGKDFTGLTATVSVTTPSPKTYVIKIDSVTQDTSTGFNDIWTYHVSVKDSSNGSFRSICLDQNGVDHDLIPIIGSYWDEQTGNRIDRPDALTLACLGGVIGKCARIGYRPWANGTLCKDSKNKNCSSVSLKDHHQACTRMFRADYCGNGQGYTKDGTIIDVFDYLDPAIQLREEKWTFEARWQPTGAMCVSKQRHPELGFTGKCKDSKGKERTLRPCNPYEEDKGLVVSTFNGTGATGIKGDGKN